MAVLLVTNDDGVHAAGLAALAAALEDLGDVHILAPEREQSACGHALIGPTPVLDQSSPRINAPISPPPARHSRSDGADGRFVFDEVPHGLVGFVLRAPGDDVRPVVTPSIEL